MRCLSSLVVLAGFVVAGQERAHATLQQDAATPDAAATLDQPLTGRALPCDNGRIASFVCQNVELLSFLPRAALANSTGDDIWGWTDSATGREFVIVGGQATAFVEITDPVNPKYLGVLPPHEGVDSHFTQSVKVYKNHAFIGYENADNGIQVFDLTQLRDVKNAPATFKETAHYDGVTSTHTLALNPESGTAFANGSKTCGGSLHMIDVRTPTKPTFAGCFQTTINGGWIHDTQCVIYRGPDQDYKDREMCFNANVGAVAIADVTDKKNPKEISSVTYPNILGAHQGWLTEDQRYFFLDDEGDEMMGLKGTRTLVFDMVDLDDPVLLTEFYNTTTDVDHNLYIRGRYMYQSNYGAGLRIIDVAEPKTPKEVGYLTNVGSAFGAYPYFKNDVVAMSTNTGLFLARLMKR